MKKLISILISLLLMASAFGVGTAIAGPNCPCDGTHFQISRSSVKVGETFTASIMADCLIDDDGRILIVGDINYWKDPVGFPIPLGPVELIALESIEDKEGCLQIIGTYKAVSQGIFTFWRCKDDSQNGDFPKGCTPSATVRITSGSLPMHSIMKILGIGNLMRE